MEKISICTEFYFLIKSLLNWVGQEQDWAIELGWAYLTCFWPIFRSPAENFPKFEQTINVLPLKGRNLMFKISVFIGLKLIHYSSFYLKMLYKLLYTACTYKEWLDSLKNQANFVQYGISFISSRKKTTKDEPYMSKDSSTKVVHEQKNINYI
jgi:hypothetical protein